MRTSLIIAAALACAAVQGSDAYAQTASPSDRDTTVQTGGPGGVSGAVGPNDNTNGSDKDGTKPSTPKSTGSKPARTHRAAKRVAPQGER